MIIRHRDHAALQSSMSLDADTLAFPGTQLPLEPVLARRQMMRMVAIAAAMLPLARARAEETVTADPLDRLGAEVVQLWPQMPPGQTEQRPRLAVEDLSSDISYPNRQLRGIEEPAIVVFRPAKANGAGVLVIPGGGYEFEAFDNEGTRQAAWLNANGITAFVLVYRLPREGWNNRSLVPLQDAQRAMRIIRFRAEHFGVDPARIATLGFSAGGHLAGSLLTRSMQKTYDPVDEADAVLATPLFAGLIYAVISLQMQTSHAKSRAALIGTNASAHAAVAASVDENVTSTTPPVFLVHANDDPIVPVANAILMYEAMRRAHRIVSLHVFERGGHGFGVNHPPTEAVSHWPQLFLAFAREEGLY